jgi:hypothetical protein
MPTDHDTPLPDPPHPNRTGARVHPDRGIDELPLTFCIHRLADLRTDGSCRNCNAPEREVTEAWQAGRSLSEGDRRNSRSSLFSPHDSGD